MRDIVSRIGHLGAWLDKRAPRERILLLVMVLVVGIFCANAWYFHPRKVERQRLQEQISTLNTTLTELDHQAEALQARAQEDPDRDNRARKQRLQAELNRLDENLKSLTVDLIPPKEMAEVLKDILTRQAGMKLVRLENRPPVELLSNAENVSEEDGEKRVSLYRHPVRIVVSGTYMQALNYLKELEKLPRKLFWEDLEIVVEEHPRSRISLTVYTLSHKRGWIGA